MLIKNLNPIKDSLLLKEKINYKKARNLVLD